MVDRVLELYPVCYIFQIFFGFFPNIWIGNWYISQRTWSPTWRAFKQKVRGPRRHMGVSFISACHSTDCFCRENANAHACSSSVWATYADVQAGCYEISQAMSRNQSSSSQTQQISEENLDYMYICACNEYVLLALQCKWLKITLFSTESYDQIHMDERKLDWRRMWISEESCTQSGMFSDKFYNSVELTILILASWIPNNASGEKRKKIQFCTDVCLVHKHFSLVCLTCHTSTNLRTEAHKSTHTKPLSQIDGARSQQCYPHSPPHQF